MTLKIRKKNKQSTFFYYYYYYENEKKALYDKHFGSQMRIYFALF